MKKEILIYYGLQPCPYLKDKVACLPLYHQLEPLTLEESDQRFARAERRVGPALYYTECQECNACQGLRIPVNEFRMSKSQRRLIRRWGQNWRIEIDEVSFSEEKLELFNRHRQGQGLIEDGMRLMTAEGYINWLVHTCMQTMETRYYYENRLVGVGILDIGRKAISSVYFYFDPALRIARLSPGVFSVLQEILFCQRTDRTYYYMGYYVEACRHLAYKAHYLPHERLIDGCWQRVEKPARRETNTL